MTKKGAVAKVKSTSNGSNDLKLKAYEGYTVGKGIWAQTWGGFPPGLINQRTNVLANVCEVRAPDNVAQVGTGFVCVGQIVPADDNTITVVLSFDGADELEFRVHLLVFVWE